MITTVAGNGPRVYGGDSGPATAAELNDPDGVAVDSAGDLFIADTGNNRVREVNRLHRRDRHRRRQRHRGYSGDNGPATAAELDVPTGVAVDSAGDLFIADDDNTGSAR